MLKDFHWTDYNYSSFLCIAMHTRLQSFAISKMVWFYILKIAVFHLSVWLICHGGWKFCHRRWFDSSQLAAQAEKWRWAGHCKF